MRTAFDLPRISLAQIERDELHKYFSEIKESRNLIAFYRTPKSEVKFLHTGLAEDEFITISIALHRHIEVYNFFKLALINIEKDLSEDCDDTYIYKALEYIRLQETKKLTFKP